jgi:hypothetical protein
MPDNVRIASYVFVGSSGFITKNDECRDIQIYHANIGPARERTLEFLTIVNSSPVFKRV